MQLTDNLQLTTMLLSQWDSTVPLPPRSKLAGGGADGKGVEMTKPEQTRSPDDVSFGAVYQPAVDKGESARGDRSADNEDPEKSPRFGVDSGKLRDDNSCC